MPNHQPPAGSEEKKPGHAGVLGPPPAGMPVRLGTGFTHFRWEDGGSGCQTVFRGTPGWDKGISEALGTPTSLTVTMASYFPSPVQGEHLSKTL